MQKTNSLNVSNIDFDSIRENLKDYMRSQDTLRDYDFEGSAISTIINLLAYTTHYNAINAHIGLNETFLETAQFRGSVVGHARQLGYTVGSPTAPVAYIDITVPSASGPLTIPKGFTVRAKIGNISYPFVTDQEYTSDTGVFENIKIIQGRYQKAEYLYDSQSSEKYLIPTSDVDTSTLIVRVFDTRTSQTFEVFTEGRDITTLTGESNMYFIFENPDGLYELIFGDGVIGSQLNNGNLIEIEYLVTQKTAANGAAVFSSSETIGGIGAYTISTRQAAAGGSERESIHSIKRNAPITFAAQNRAVLPDDFDAIIRSSFSDVRSIKVWGGEDNDPPVYGKVFISILPKTSDRLSESQKRFLLDEVINPKAVVTTTPEIIDPEFLRITAEIFFKYDPTRTVLSESQLESAIETSLREYNDNELLGFDNVFRYSQFLNAIDQTNESILNSFARIYVFKRFIPVLNSPTTYTLDYSVDLYESFGQRPVINDSSLFTINNLNNCRFKDFLQPDGTTRIISIVRGIGASEEVIVRNAGLIEGSKIVITNFAPQSISGDSIKIEVVPASYDIVGSFNNVVSFDCDCAKFIVTGEVDTIVTGRDYSGRNYQTIPRDK